MERENQDHEPDAGSIRIGEDVVSTIATQASQEVPGVAGLTGALSGVLGKRAGGPGVKVDVKGEQAYIDVMIAVDFGSRIPDVAWKVQERVKSKVERMTGLSVMAVNVHVQGLRFEKEPGSREEGRVR